MIKELWSFTDDRLAVRFAYEWHDDNGNWFRSYGNENWEFSSDGLMKRRFPSINFATSLLNLFAIIIAGGSVANEFRWGTIKQLLIRPISRGTILLSKYVAVLVFVLLSVLSLLGVSFFIGLIMYGVPAVNPDILVNRPDGLASNDILSEILLQSGFKFINIIILATFGFMLSSIFRSSALAIGLSMFMMFAGTTAAQALSQYAWAKYILFANTDLSVYFTSFGPIREEMTMGFSAAVIVVYMVIFIAATWLVFNKRNVV